LAYTGATGGLFPSDTQYPTGLPLPQVTLTDVKDQLRITGTTNDAELTGYLQAAQSRIADICVPVGPATVQDTFDGVVGAGSLVLSTSPVTAITSLTVYDTLGNPTALSPAGGATGILDGYRANLSAGMVRRVGYRTWPSGWGNIVAVYTVGPAVTPVEVWMAVVLTAAQWWEARRLSGNLRAPGGTNDDAGDVTVPTFGVPDEAYDLLLNYLKPPRVA
jgi:uncharacterized phiE125 gp8 family phage protein